MNRELRAKLDRLAYEYGVSEMMDELAWICIARAGVCEARNAPRAKVLREAAERLNLMGGAISAYKVEMVPIDESQD